MTNATSPIDNHYARGDWKPGLATSIGFVTCVGHMAAHDPKNYPLKRGNCFGMQVKTSEHLNKEFRILNFCYENLKALLDTKIVEFPIKVLMVSDNCAVVHDTRIPHDWYTPFCNSCTPLELMAPERRLLKWRMVESGEITIHGGDVLRMESQMIGGDKKTLRMEWHKGKDGTKSFEAVTSVETPPTMVWIKNGKAVKKVGGSIRKIRHDAGIPGTKGRPPSDKPIQIVIKKQDVKAVSRSMQLPPNWRVESQQGITFTAEDFKPQKGGIMARYGVKKLKKKLYGKVKLGVASKGAKARKK